jgi:hypothetical protein
MKPAPNSRRIAGMPPTRSTGDDRDPRASGCAVGATVASNRGWSADVTVGSVMGRWGRDRRGRRSPGTCGR